MQEDAEEEGLDIPPPPASAIKWSENDIRKYFETKGAYKPLVVTDLKEPSSEEFDRWFPGLKRSGTKQDNPDLRVICFHNAGNAEDMYTSEGTGIRRAASPLLVCGYIMPVFSFCREGHITGKECPCCRRNGVDHIMPSA